MDFSQIMILVFGCSAIWLIGRKENWKRWGYIIGFIAQPFWFYTGISNEQWGIVALTAVYTFLWGLGIYNYWIKRE
jgi:hypothetical protein